MQNNTLISFETHKIFFFLIWGYHITSDLSTSLNIIKDVNLYGKDLIVHECQIPSIQYLEAGLVSKWLDVFPIVESGC